MSKIDKLKKLVETNNLVNEDMKVNEVGRFWVVVVGTNSSTLKDLCFEAGVITMMIASTKGGLEWRDVLGLFKNGDKAKEFTREYYKKEFGKDI